MLLDHAGVEVRGIDTDGTSASLARALASLTEAELALHVQLRSPSLDDAFIALTQKPNDHQETAA